MMQWMLESSMRLRSLVIVVAVALLVFGATQLRRMPVDVYPEFDPPLVEIQTEALGLSADEVESLITVPMEADLLNGVAWLDQIYSESVAGLSSILLVFEPGTDPIRARQMVSERLTQAFALPNVSKPPEMLQPVSSSNRVMMVGLTSKDLSLIELGVLARWNIKPRLMGLPGVANVAIWGQRERQLQVLVDPKVLQARGATIGQVIETAGEALWVSPLSYLEASTPGTAGWIDTPNQRLGIRHLLPIVTPEDLAKVALAEHEGLLLGDVATVVEDHQPLIGDALLSNGAGLLLVIEKFPGANTLDVTRELEEALAVMQPGLTGVAIDTTVFRPASYIELATGNLSTAALIAALLVLVVLGSFLFHWRTALISMLAIPLALVAAAFVLYLRGATFNLMVLAGLAIALGAVIDDAVVDVEQVARRLRQARQAGDERPPGAIILAAVLEMRGALGFATLIMLLAVLPVFFLTGLTGDFFRPLAVAYTLALLAALAVALVVTPALCMALLPSAPLDRREPVLVRWLQQRYGAALARNIRSPRLAYVATVVVVLAGLVALPLMGQSLLPTLKQTELLIRWEATPGTAREEMNRIAAQASAELRGIAGVRNVGSHIGRAMTGDQVVGINSGELWLSLDPAADYATTIAAIQEVINGYPGIFHEVQAYQPKRIGEALTRPAHDLVVRVYGHDLPTLRTKAQEVQQAMLQVNGVSGAQADLQVEEPQVEIEVDLGAAERYGLKPGDVRRQATTLLSGLQVGNLFEEQKVFDVVVWGVPSIRSSLSAIRDLLIDTPDGEYVRLGEVANVRIAPSTTIIRRDAVSRYIDVGMNVSGRSLAAVSAEAKGRLAAISFPAEFHAEVLGDAAARQAALWRLVVVIVLALIGMFLILQAAFASWRLATLVFLLLPLALAGGVLTPLVVGGTLSLGTLFGLATVFGLAVRSNILLVRRWQRLEHDERQAFGPELVLQGAQERLAPTLMTALATALALAPCLALGAIPGLELIVPMAVTIIGGLVTASLLSLFVLPSLYLRFGASPAPDTAGRQYVPVPAAG